MKLIVDPVQRYAKMRAHTATHLLHFALGELLGTTKQAGSLVDEDYLRFDFAAKQPLTLQELQTIESKVNHWIRHARDVSIEEMNYASAISSGAKAFFEDKYGDVVRVVSIVDNDISLRSIELCGGTHVANTSWIGAFLITGQEAVASGIRRITAVTGPAVAVHAQTLTHELTILSEKFDCQPKQLHEKVDKFLKEFSHLQTAHEALQAQMVKAQLLELSQKSNHTSSEFSHIIALSSNDLNLHDFKVVVTQARTLRPDISRAIYTHEGNYAIFSATGQPTAKAFAQQHQLKGGGAEHLIQGRDPKIVGIFS